MHAVGREEVLLDLVGDDAEAGFFDGQARELFGARPRGGGHRVDDAIDLVLGELGEGGRGGLARCARAGARRDPTGDWSRSAGAGASAIVRSGYVRAGGAAEPGRTDRPRRAAGE